MTQRDLSLKSGFSPSYVNRIESGEQSPSLEALAAMASTLGVSPSVLVAEESDLISTNGPTTNGESPSVLSRPAFERRMDQELHRSKRYERPLCVIMMHPEDPARNGMDRQATAQTLAKHLRASDIMALWTPPNLSGAFPETSRKQAKTAAQRIRSFVETNDLGQWWIGLAECNPSFPDVETLLTRAEEAVAKGHETNQPVTML